MSDHFQSNDSGLSANGRFGRLSYFAWNILLGFFVLFCVIVLAVIMPSMMTNLSSGAGFSSGFILFFLIIYIILFYFSFVFIIRRLHDLNKSGWLSLILLIPVAGLFFWIYASCAKGDISTNNYGAPRITRGWEKVLGWINIVLVPLSIIITAAVALPAYQSYVERVKMIQYNQQMNQSE